VSMFIKKCGFLIFIVLLTIGIIVFVIPFDKSSYLAANIDKQERLKILGSPKIVLIGGSNIAFSVNSEKIEKTFALPVVNMALHAGIGLIYMLSEVKDYIVSGDVILVIPEYSHFFNDLNGGEEVLEVIFSFPANFRYIESSKQYFALLRAVPLRAQGKFMNYVTITAKRIISHNQTPQSDEVYSRGAFNRNGDVISHLNKKSKREKVIRDSKSNLPSIKSFNKEAIKMLNDFYSYASERKARVLFDFPDVLDIWYKNNEEKINFVYDRLKEELKIPIIGQPQEYVFPIESFFDTMYHMNAEGRELRTQKVIADLTPFIQ